MGQAAPPHPRNEHPGTVHIHSEEEATERLIIVMLLK